MRSKLQRALDYGSVEGEHISLPRMLPAEEIDREVRFLMPSGLVQQRLPCIEYELSHTLQQHPCKFRKAIALRNGGAAIIRQDAGNVFYLSSIPPVGDRDIYCIDRRVGVGRNVVGDMSYSISGDEMHIENMVLERNTGLHRSLRGQGVSRLLFYFLIDEALTHHLFSSIVINSRIQRLLKSDRIREVLGLAERINLKRPSFQREVGLIQDLLDELLEYEDLTYGCWKQYGFQVSDSPKHWERRKRNDLVPCTVTLSGLIVK